MELYPEYVPLIIGSSKVLALLALVYPRTQRLREWAASGLAILFIGAFVSHTIVEGSAKGASALLCLAFLLAGYFTSRLRVIQIPDAQVAPV